MQDNLEQSEPNRQVEPSQRLAPEPPLEGNPPDPNQQLQPHQQEMESGQQVGSQDGLWRWDGNQWVSNAPNEYAVGQRTPDGLWSWNGYEWRSTMPVPVENQSIAAPLSYVGSAQRIWQLSHNAPRAVFVPVSMLLVACAWMFVTWWYILIFGVFGVFVIPFRLMTRSQRKRLRQAERQHREMMAMLSARR